MAKICPKLSRFLSVLLMTLIVIPFTAVAVYADIDIPAGIPGAGHNVTDPTCPEEINGVGVTMKKIAIVPGSHPQGIAYGDGYFFIAYHQGVGGDGGSGTVHRIPESNVLNANGGVAQPDKSFTASIGHGQGIEYYNGLLYIAPGDGYSLKAYDKDGNLKKTENTKPPSHYHLAIDKTGTVWNVSSGGSENGDRTNARYVKLGSNSWDSVGMNHGANRTQASQGGGYNPATDRVAFMSNGIIMTFPAKKDMKGSDVHMFPFNCNPESEGITFMSSGTGYAILRNEAAGNYFIMEVQLDDDKVEDDREKFDFSFYQLASDASVEFQQQVMDGSASEMIESDSKVGSAATYLGYTKSAKGTLHVLATRNSQNTISYDYKSIDKIGKIIDDTGDAGNGIGFAAYTNYGRVLTDLGYDEVGQTTTKAARLFTGGLLLVAYYLSIAVPFLFGYILDFLRAFNPFALLGITSTKLATYGGSLEALAGRFNDVYNALYDLSLFVMLPLMAAIMFGMALLSGRGAGQKASRVIIEFVAKILLLLFAVPVVGAGYTHLLDDIDNMQVFGPSAINQIVYSELVDFQGWAHNTNINPPDGIELKWEDNDEAKLPKQGIRRGARKINVLAGHKDAAIKGGGRDDFLNGYKENESSGMKLELNDYTGYRAETDTGEYASQILDVHNLMMRYTKADVYSASTYETEVKEVIMKRVAEGDRSVKAMILDGAAGGARYGASVGTLFGNGTMGYSKSSGYSPGVVDGDMLTGNRGLSTLGMYNYLSSKYDNAGMTIYGANVSNNERVKDTHMSVTAVGTGFYGVALYTQTLVSLFCIGLIGFVYGIGFILISFKRGFQTIIAVPGMMIGSKKMIGKFLSAAFLLFAEILITIGFYALFCEFILVVNDAFVSIVN